MNLFNNFSASTTEGTYPNMFFTDFTTSLNLSFIKWYSYGKSSLGGNALFLPKEVLFDIVAEYMNSGNFIII